MTMTMPTLTMNSTTTDEIDYYDNGKGDNDEGNTEMDGNNDDAYTYDDDDDDYDDDDESYCFRYQIMRNCWQEEPDDRPSFEQLRRELKLMENQHKVIYRNLTLSLRYLSYNVHMK